MTPRSRANHPFLTSVLLLAILLLIQIQFPGLIPAGDYIFVALLVFSFFLDFFEILILTLVSAYILNWYPMLSLPLLVFMALPLLSWLVAQVFSWKKWAAFLVVEVGALVLLYTTVLFPFGTSEVYQLLKVIGGDTLFSIVVFWMYLHLYVSKTTIKQLRA